MSSGVPWRVVAAAVAGLVVGVWLGRRGGGGRLRGRLRVGLSECIGDTHLCELPHLSRALGRQVLVKLEFLNPGGTAKDRAARQMLSDALQSGLLRRGGTVFEGSAGSTGISLTLMAWSQGCHTHICIPDDMAREKSDLLTCLGAQVERVPPTTFSDPEHFCNLAKRRALHHEGGFFVDQFDNLSNRTAHYSTTGPELWEQVDGNLQVLVCAAGTGGLVAGVSTFLKEQDPSISVVLIDPPGSSLANRVNHGVAWSDKEREGSRKRRQVDTLCEGIGLTGRVTANFSEADIDLALKCTDQECVDMARWVLHHEGFFIGSSSAAHLVGVVKAARRVPEGSRIATFLCDAGYRHLSKFWNAEFLAKSGLMVRDFGVNDLSFIS